MGLVGGAGIARPEAQILDAAVADPAGLFDSVHLTAPVEILDSVDDGDVDSDGVIMHADDPALLGDSVAVRGPALLAHGQIVDPELIGSGQNSHHIARGEPVSSRHRERSCRIPKWLLQMSIDCLFLHTPHFTRLPIRFTGTVRRLLHCRYIGMIRHTKL